jgi:undecaprenyl-diphosphatase
MLSGLMVHLIKWVVADLRPIALLDSVHVVGPLLRSGSFPSGHAASVTAAGLAIAHYWPSRPAIAMVLSLGALICLSRILVGAHFPSDILGGIILSLVLFRVVLLFAWPKLEAVIADAPSFSRTSFRWAFRVELVVIIFVLMAYGPLLADSPVTAVVVAVVLLTVLGWERSLHKRAGKAC